MGCCESNEAVAVTTTITQVRVEPTMKIEGLITEYQKFRLQTKTQYNHDSYIFRFALQSRTAILHLPIGNHLMLRIDEAKLSDFPISRPYTPISNDSDVGFFDLLIKIYADGEFTQILNKLQIDDIVLAKGPIGRITYIPPTEQQMPAVIKVMNGSNNFDSLHCKQLNLIGGGTGITPLYQIMRYIYQNRGLDNNDNANTSISDETEISLMFANKTPEDILLKQELLDMIENDPRIRISFLVSKNESLKNANTDKNEYNFQFTVGKIDIPLMTEHLFKPSQNCVSMFCGPIGFNKFVKKSLKIMGHSDDRILRF